MSAAEYTPDDEPIVEARRQVDPARALSVMEVRLRTGCEGLAKLRIHPASIPPPACADCGARARSESAGLADNPSARKHDASPLNSLWRSRYAMPPLWFCGKCYNLLTLRAEWAACLPVGPMIGFDGYVFPEFRPPAGALNAALGTDPREIRRAWGFDESLIRVESWERRLRAAFDRAAAAPSGAQP